jgi:hypothetical protein
MGRRHCWSWAPLRAGVAVADHTLLTPREDKIPHAAPDLLSATRAASWKAPGPDGHTVGPELP